MILAGLVIIGLRATNEQAKDADFETMKSELRGIKKTIYEVEAINGNISQANKEMIGWEQAIKSLEERKLRIFLEKVKDKTHEGINDWRDYVWRDTNVLGDDKRKELFTTIQTWTRQETDIQKKKFAEMIVAYKKNKN